MEEMALKDLLEALGSMKMTPEPDKLQELLYEIGKRYSFADLRAWFHNLYQLLLGQEEGPRMGSFISLYGIEETRILIQEVLQQKKSRMSF